MAAGRELGAGDFAGHPDVLKFAAEQVADGRVQLADFDRLGAAAQTPAQIAPWILFSPRTVEETLGGQDIDPQAKLERCVDRILQSEGVPPFCKHAQEVVTRTLDLEGSCPELARVVLKDLGLTSQLLRVANSARYNRSGRGVMSVAHAMILLGWDTVRDLVSTIRYIEHFAGRAPGVRELLLLSVLTAAHSRHIADVLGYPYPEDAHICGLFRNLGEVLIGCHYPREYSNIILKLHFEKIPARAACTEVLDFAWDDVALRVAARWNMPPTLVHCLGGPARPIGSMPDRPLASITTYAHDLTQALYRHQDGPEAFHLRQVLGPDGHVKLVSVRDLRRVIDSAMRETQHMFSALDISSGNLGLEWQASPRAISSLPRRSLMPRLCSG